MANQCSTCFFSFIAPASADSRVAPSGAASQIPPARFAGKRFCAHDAPFANNTNPDAWLWPLVQDDWWCGEGASIVDGSSFAGFVNAPSSLTAKSTGTFAYAAQSSVTVTNAACTATSIVKVWNISFTGTPLNPQAAAPALTITPGAGSFGAATADSSVITATYGYTIFGP